MHENICTDLINLTAATPANSVCRLLPFQVLTIFRTGSTPAYPLNVTNCVDHNIIVYFRTLKVAMQTGIIVINRTKEVQVITYAHVFLFIFLYFFY
jgi:hypothetical protein